MPQQYPPEPEPPGTLPGPQWLWGAERELWWAWHLGVPVAFLLLVVVLALGCGALVDWLCRPEPRWMARRRHERAPLLPVRTGSDPRGTRIYYQAVDRGTRASRNPYEAGPA